MRYTQFLTVGNVIRSQTKQLENFINTWLMNHFYMTEINEKKEKLEREFLDYAREINAEPLAQIMLVQIKG